MGDLENCISRLRLSYGLPPRYTVRSQFETCSHLSIISACLEIADFFIACVQ